MTEEEVYKSILDIDDGISSVVLIDKNGKRIPDYRMQDNLLSYCLRTYNNMHKKWQKKFREIIEK